jgi:hypothetical protein
VQVLASFWVHIPPLKTLAGMNKRVAEFKKKGVTGYRSVVEPGKWQFAISLGNYLTEDEARKRLAKLLELGVTQAAIGSREGTATRTAFVVRDASEQVSAKLLELRTSFPTTEIKTVECPSDAPLPVSDVPVRPDARPAR